MGDAAWWAETYNSGVLYGDPLYSPAEIRFRYLNDRDRVADDLMPLYASTINGRDPEQVHTAFAVDYRAGSDFFDCDAAGTWIPTGLALDGNEPTTLIWDSQTQVLYDVVGGMLSDLLAHGEYAEAECLFDNNVQTRYFDNRPPPPAAEAYYDLVRAQGIGTGSHGNARTDAPDPRNELDLASPCP